MSNKIKYTGIIKGGQLHIVHRKAFDEDIAQIGKIRGEVKDVKVYITVEKQFKKRSIMQNAYYHGVVCQCFLNGVNDQWGENHNHDWAHEQLKFHCNFDEKLSNTGELVKVAKTTTKLTTFEFMEYLESCRELIAEWFGIYVPEPNEQIEIKL